MGCKESGHTSWTVSGLRPCIDGPVDRAGHSWVPEAQVRGLIVVVVGAAAVQRVVQAEGHLAVWGRVLLGRVAAGRLQRFMIGMPA